eukprot:PhF_6_TR26363/c0_g1_i1/m.37990
MNDNFALANYASVGRSLYTTKPWKAGEIVLTDTPILRWDATATIDPEIQRLKDSEPLVPQMYAAAVDAFVRCGAQQPEVRRVILDLHVPSLPISENTFALFRFAQRVVDMIGLDSTTTNAADLVKVMLGAKVNAHRAPNGEWCVMPIGSKLAHSCDPNLYYHAYTFSFVAVRPIQAGEMLSFSYLSLPLLITGTEARQKKLFGSHLFVCACVRCGGVDECRTFMCPKCNATTLRRDKSALVLTDADQRNNNVAVGHGQCVWNCSSSSCGVSLSDAAIQTQLELEESITLSLTAIVQDSNGYKYKEIRSLLSEAKAKLGIKHWTYIKLCYHFSLYFKMFAAHGYGDAASHMCLNWGLVYLMRLEDIGWKIFDLPEGHIVHPLIASFIFTLYDNGKTYRKYTTVLHCLTQRALPFAAACYGEGDTKVISMREFLAANASPLTSSSPLPPKSLAEVVGQIEDSGPRLINAAGVDDWLLMLWDTNMMMRMWKNQMGGGGGPGTPGGMSASNTTHSSQQSLADMDEY